MRAGPRRMAALETCQERTLFPNGKHLTCFDGCPFAYPGDHFGLYFCLKWGLIFLEIFNQYAQSRYRIAPHN